MVVSRPNASFAVGITANPGGGQANAVTLTKKVNVISTVATTGDSVALPLGAAQKVFVANQGANSMDVYPATGDSINEGSANAAFAVASGKNAMFVSSGPGNPWLAILSD